MEFAISLASVAVNFLYLFGDLCSRALAQNFSRSLR
jgi:hypothetical protein